MNLVIFDFDGVITDSFDFNLQIEKRRRGENFSSKEYRDLFKGNINIAVADQVPKDLSLDFHKEYGKGIHGCSPFEGVGEVIQVLADSYRLAIISSSTSNNIRDYLDATEMSDCFAEVLGADVDFSKIKKFQMLFEKYGVEAKDCIFITDTLGDLREAEEVGLPSIAVTWGFHPKETLMRGKFVEIVDKPHDLIRVINNCFK